MERQNQQNQLPAKNNPYMGMLWVLLIVLFLNGLIFSQFTRPRIIETDYGSFIGKVDSGLVRNVMIKNG